MPVLALNASRTFWNDSCSLPPHSEVTLIEPPAPAAALPLASAPALALAPALAPALASVLAPALASVLAAALGAAALAAAEAAPPLAPAVPPELPQAVTTSAHIITRERTRSDRCMYDPPGSSGATTGCGTTDGV